MNQIDLMRLTLLFCDGANRMPVVAIVPTHIVAATVEVEAVGAAGTAPAGRGTPIVAVLTNVVTRRPVTAARSRKKDTVAIRASYSVAVYTTLAYPTPGTFVF